MARQLGERVRRTRLVSRRQQNVVAGLAGITTDYLYQIERGHKLPSLTVLAELARVLDVSVSALVGETPLSVDRGGGASANVTARSALTTPTKSAPRRSGTVSVGGDLYEAMTSRSALVGSRPEAVARLGDDIRHAWCIWQQSPHRYSKLGALVPRLVVETEGRLLNLTSTADSVDRRAAARDACSLYGLLRSFCKRVGRMELALLAADRALRAAELADDPVHLAAGKWNMAHVLLADGEIAGAEDTAMVGVEEIAPRLNGSSGMEPATLCGSLLLVGAMAAVRRGDLHVARQRVRRADEIAAVTGEQNTCGTVFGPTNVAMHAASVELVSGRSAEGLHLAERIDHRSSPSIERRVAFLLDQAAAWRKKRDNAQALLLLLETEREAPEDIRHRPMARDLVGQLVAHGRRPVAEQAAQVAQRLQLAV